MFPNFPYFPRFQFRSGSGLTPLFRRPCLQVGVGGRAFCHAPLLSCSCFNGTEVPWRSKACLLLQRLPTTLMQSSAFPNCVLATERLRVEILLFKNRMFQKDWSCVGEDSLEFMGVFNARIAVLAWTLDFLIHKLRWHLLICAIYFSMWKKPELCITSPQVFFLFITSKGAAVY